ncbi:hypothetical protein EPN81_04385 [Patescibacteria group bacterium]|nr:MAG: hypothetical protein EPN81_04385 [Patescibacteria group bacterium]
MQQTFNVLAGVLFVAAFVPYIRAILKKQAQPMKSTWLIWATLDTITLAGMWANDSVNGQITGAILGAWTVTILAFKFGESGWSLLDKLCLAGAALGIILWQTFDNPTLGMMTSLSVIFLGSIPTFVSAWKDPNKENKLAWWIYWASCVCALIGVPNWTLQDAAQPITFFAIETIMVFILTYRPIKLRVTA